MATEKRLIDANALIEEMKDCAITRQDLYCNGYAQTFIENAPTVDAVEVVRCKDCDYFVGDCDKYNPHCRLHAILVDEDDFCSYGERKDNE